MSSLAEFTARRKTTGMAKGKQTMFVEEAELLVIWLCDFEQEWVGFDDLIPKTRAGLDNRDEVPASRFELAIRAIVGFKMADSDVVKHLGQVLSSFRCAKFRFLVVEREDFAVTASQSRWRLTVHNEVHSRYRAD